MTGMIAAAAGLLAACSSEPPSSPSDTCTTDRCDSISGQTFDYIVVGSGAGGGPLASNLARAGHKVLLLEAGEDTGGKLTSQVPVLHARSTEDPDLAWWYFVDHYSDPEQQARDTKLTEAGVMYPRGGTLGGSTAVNAMITVAPKNSDWDYIAELTGDSSWSHEAMNPYYDRVLSWLSVERPDPAIGLADSKIVAILKSAAAEFVNATSDGSGSNPFGLFDTIDQLIGILTRDINTDIQSGRTEGLYSFPLATRDGKRNGPRDYILETVAEGYPLTVKTSALVTNVIFADAPAADGMPRAIGVEYLDGAHLYRADFRAADAPLPPKQRALASREVILSAGAFNTPQLLKLSGIGPRDELEALGIPVRVDLPGVGENLQDRYEVGVISETRSDFGVIQPCNFATTDDDVCLERWQDGYGVYTTNGTIGSILMKSSPEQPEADLHIFGVPGMFKGYYPGYSADGTADKRHFTWVILKGHTENRAGTIKLRSTDPRDRPLINFHYFDDGDVDEGQDINDLTAVVNAVELVRRIGDTTDSKLWFSRFQEVWPGREVATRDDIAQWVKDEAWGHHASCSARIGADSDPMAVLDSRFRVRGTRGLRVVDASVFPRIPGTFIVLPIYMVSEKATDLILEDADQPDAASPAASSLDIQ